MSTVKELNRVIKFGMEQLLIYIAARNEDYKKNSKIKDSHPIVYHENLALMEEELIFLKHNIELSRTIDLSRFAAPESYRDFLIEEIKKYNQFHGAPGVCNVIMKEKIEMCYHFFLEFFKESGS